jgi:hydrogenase-4 membrane subunit HyfE
MNKLFSLLILLLLMAHEVSAQDMAVDMRSNGKIYVVVFVLATIFAGIFTFLVYLEKRLKNLESKK